MPSFTFRFENNMKIQAPVALSAPQWQASVARTWDKTRNVCSGVQFCETLNGNHIAAANISATVDCSPQNTDGDSHSWNISRERGNMLHNASRPQGQTNLFNIPGALPT